MDGDPSGIARWIPGLQAVRTYDRKWTRSDVVAGVVLAAILVPQGLAYAELAGLPPVTGFYTSIGCLVGYAVFGPSKILVLGPDSSISPLIFAALLPLLAAGGDAHRAIALAGMLAIIVALIEIGLGLGKLGFVADLLSSEVQVGYMNGLALIIIVGQLPKLFGFSTDAEGFGPELKAFVARARRHRRCGAGGRARGPGDLVGAVPIHQGRPCGPRRNRGGHCRLRRSSTCMLTGSRPWGRFPEGVPTPSVPWTKWADVGPLAVAAVGITLVSLADTIATSSSFGARRGEEVDPNQEMIGIGAANLAAGLLQGFAVSTSGSRTAVVEQAGAKSQLASLVGAGIVVALLLFFNSLLADLPQSALAAVLIAAALSLLDLGALVRYYRVRKSALVLSVVASLGVIVFGVLPGIVIAIVLAVLLFFRRSWQPHGAVLGEVGELGGLAQRRAIPRRTRNFPGSSSTAGRPRCSSRTASAFRTQIRHARRRAPCHVGRRPMRGDDRCRCVGSENARAARP